MADAHMIISPKTLADSINDLPDGSLDFVYASYDEVGNTLTISSIPEDEKVSSIIQSNNFNTTDTTSIISNMKIKNDLSKNKNDLLKEQNDISASMVNELKQQNKIMTATFNLMVLNASKQENHDNYETAKNSMTIDRLNFEMYGKDNFLDTGGNAIIPQEEKAKYHAEKRIDEERTNKFNVTTMLNDFDKNDDTDIDKNIMTEVMNSMINSIDVTKIDKNGEI